jgi:hypothetical protein
LSFLQPLLDLGGRDVELDHLVTIRVRKTILESGTTNKDSFLLQGLQDDVNTLLHCHLLVLDDELGIQGWLIGIIHTYTRVSK